MVNLRGVRWLYGQLPLLVQNGMVSAASAGALNRPHGLGR